MQWSCFPYADLFKLSDGIMVGIPSGAFCFLRRNYSESSIYSTYCCCWGMNRKKCLLWTYIFLFNNLMMYWLNWQHYSRIEEVVILLFIIHKSLSHFYQTFPDIFFLSLTCIRQFFPLPSKVHTILNVSMLCPYPYIFQSRWVECRWTEGRWKFIGLSCAEAVVMLES